MYIMSSSLSHISRIPCWAVDVVQLEAVLGIHGLAQEMIFLKLKNLEFRNFK